MLYRSVLICLTSLVFNCLAEIKVHNVSISNEEIGIIRLPDTIIPKVYNLWIKTNVHLNDFDFIGVVNVAIEVNELTKIITLHSKQLNILSAKLWNNHVSPPESVDLAIDLKNDEQLMLTAEEFINVGLYELEISYQGELRDDDLGFYKTSYINENGTEKWLATTQFAAMNARHGFPCFDEPALKAIFYLKIEHGCLYTAISNTEVLLIEEVINSIDGLCTTTFHPTPIMSTYLIAYIISDFQRIENYEGPIQPNRTKHRVYANAKNLPHAYHALAFGESILSAYENWTGIQFPISKMEQIAFPNFFFVAMENWGLVVYDEKKFYFEEDNDYHSKYEIIDVLIAHEFAHQWFGNLVTLEWWEHIWLNEGFARLFENVMLIEKYDRMKYFGVRTQHPAMQYDMSNKSRPMNYLPTDTEKIMDLFDKIVYDKAASVLRMMMYSLTEPIFQKGLQNYLESRQFENSHPDHLFAGIQNAINDELPGIFPPGFDFKTVFTTWATQKGFPLLTVHYDSVTGNITITQEPYTNEKETSRSGLWWIPINFVTQSERFNDNIVRSTRPDFWLSQEKVTILPTEFRNWTSDSWILMNRENVGYYRVNYNEELWWKIIEELKTPELSQYKSRTVETQRAQLIDDSIDLAFTGRLSFDILFNLLKSFNYENTLCGWEAANNGLDRLNNAIAGTEYYVRFLKYAQSILISRYLVYGLKTPPIGETITEGYIRPIVVDWACQMYVSPCLNETQVLLTQYLNGEYMPESLVREFIIKNGLRTSDRSQFLKILKRLENEKGEKRNEIISGIGKTHDADLRDIIFNIILTNNGESVEEIEINLSEDERVNILLSMINSNDDGYIAARQFMTLEGTESRITKIITLPKYYKTLFKAFSDRTVTEERLASLKVLFQIYETQTITIADDIESFVAVAEDKLAWEQKYGGIIEKWLIDNEFNDGTDGSSTLAITTMLIIINVVACRLF